MSSTAITDWCESHRSKRVHPDVQICQNHLHSDAACTFVHAGWCGHCQHGRTEWEACEFSACDTPDSSTPTGGES